MSSLKATEVSGICFASVEDRPDAEDTRRRCESQRAESARPSFAEFRVSVSSSGEPTAAPATHSCLDVAEGEPSARQEQNLSQRSVKVVSNSQHTSNICFSSVSSRTHQRQDCSSLMQYFVSRCLSSSVGQFNREAKRRGCADRRRALSKSPVKPSATKSRTIVGSRRMERSDIRKRTEDPSGLKHVRDSVLTVWPSKEKPRRFTRRACNKLLFTF
mmetsp:Transcript_14485/g.24708  ORF Transcript_14485/g.24708 Transcript_14485/m.24708 type:complete len:216 (-) Transcript_14485:552-1199(-)